MRLLTRLCCALFVVLLSLLSSLIPPTASASNFTVNSFGDAPDANAFDGLCADANGVCTLRAAIQQANATPADDVIGVGVAGTINLTSALPDISTSMTINGRGADLLTVRRGSDGPYRIFTIAAGVNVRISGLTVSNGLAPPHVDGDDPGGGGGGIYNAGALTLAGVTVSGNATSTVLSSPVRTPAGGGGIQNDGVLTMTDCVVSGNRTADGGIGSSAGNGGAGGGLLNTGTLVMTNCAVSGNRTGDGGIGQVAGNGGAGGGIYNAPNGPRQVSASLMNCLVTGNTTGAGARAPRRFTSSHNGDGGKGGGIYNGSAMTVVAGTISNNLTGSGAESSPPTEISVPQLLAGKGGAGGGVYNDIPPGGGELKMTNCVVSGNKTGAGGANKGGDGGDGGGVANPSADSVLEMSQCTVVFNETGIAGAGGGGRDGIGGGVYGVPRIRGSVVALNVVRSPADASDVAGGPILSSGFNYFGYFGGLCCYMSSDHGGTDGGTHLSLKLDANLIPLPSSPLIEAGLALDVDGQPVTTDMRGAARPFNFPGVASQPGSDDSDVGAFERQAADTTPTPTPTPPSVQFAASTAHVAEGCVQANITITRTGPKNGTTVAAYSVIDFFEFGAFQRGDFTRASGRVTFAPGQDTKTIPVLLSEDAYSESSDEVFIVVVRAVEGGRAGLPDTIILTIDDNDRTDGTTNPIDDNATFVGQHYHDFLGRHADAGGQAFWTARLGECGGDAACLDRKRVDVSAAFFLSQEFQNTGYFVIRFNKVAFGDHYPGDPFYTLFLEQMQQVARGVIVGRPGYAELLEANKLRFTEEFVRGPFFQAVYGSMNAAPFVDALFANVGVTPTAAERDAAISAFGAGGAAGQAAALRSLIESGSVYNKLYNPAFVLMQYFAYLRRDPNHAPDTNFDGYSFWLNKLDAATLPGEDARDETVAIRRIRRAEMVRSFLRSDEYRGRFGGDRRSGNP